MKHYPILLLMLILPSRLWAQSDQQLASYLQQNQAADSNGAAEQNKVSSHR